MMEAKRKRLTAIVLSLVLIAMSLTCLCCFTNGNVANAQTTESDSAIETRGLVTTLSISLGASDGNVWALARNEFTLGFSTIQVYVELYSSPTYCEDVSQMRLESYNYIADLNIGKSIQTSTPIAGVQKYWRARIRFKFDEKVWETKESGTFLIDVDGSVIR